MNNIVLIGMPSCGKSTVGVLLAKKLGYRFLDSDILIQEKCGMLLHEIIETEGLNGFLKIEGEVNRSIQTDRTVISTGGSVVYSDDAMKHLKSIGKVIYIKISYETLCMRLGDYVHRGVVMPKGYTLLDMYNERKELYEKYADFILDEGDDSINKTLERIAQMCADRL